MLVGAEPAEHRNIRARAREVDGVAAIRIHGHGLERDDLIEVFVPDDELVVARGDVRNRESAVLVARGRKQSRTRRAGEHLVQADPAVRQWVAGMERIVRRPRHVHVDDAATDRTALTARSDRHSRQSVHRTNEADVGVMKSGAELGECAIARLARLDPGVDAPRALDRVRLLPILADDRDHLHAVLGGRDVLDQRFTDREVVGIQRRIADFRRRHRPDRAVAETTQTAVVVVLGAQRISIDIRGQLAAGVVDEHQEPADAGLTVVPGVVDRGDVLERAHPDLGRRQRLRRDDHRHIGRRRPAKSRFAARHREATTGTVAIAPLGATGRSIRRLIREHRHVIALVRIGYRDGDRGISSDGVATRHNGHVALVQIDGQAVRTARCAWRHGVGGVFFDQPSIADRGQRHGRAATPLRSDHREIDGSRRTRDGCRASDQCDQRRTPPREQRDTRRDG